MTHRRGKPCDFPGECETCLRAGADAGSVYARICLAAYRGTGVRISVEEAIRLANDDAIEVVASQDAGMAMHRKGVAAE